MCTARIFRRGRDRSLPWQAQRKTLLPFGPSRLQPKAEFRGLLERLFVRLLQLGYISLSILHIAHLSTKYRASRLHICLLCEALRQLVRLHKPGLEDLGSELFVLVQS